VLIVRAPNNPSVAMFVAAALFADGAAAVVLRSGAAVAGDRPSARPASIVAAGEHCWRDTEHIMGWDIKADGFGVVLSPQLPGLTH
jgi:alkylresorcinol/alkylpyrone synthase